MRGLIHPHGLSLFISSDGQEQSTVAFAALMDGLVNGANVVALVESSADGSTFRSRASDWLKAHDENAVYLDRVFALSSYRTHHDPEKLANKITDLAGDKQLVVFADLARTMLAVSPDDQRLRWLSRVAQHIVVATVVSATYGPSGMPAPRLSDYEADRVYRTQYASSQVRKVKVTRITPPGEPIILQVKTGWGNVPMLVNEEAEYAG